LLVDDHRHLWHDRGCPTNIIAIVDAYDAMTTDRPYRRALTPERAVQRLRARSGIQWDPELTALFISLIEHKRLLAPGDVSIAHYASVA
jgi:putative two-component system response regulator